MIVLHTTKYSDTALIIHAYCREGGRESYIIRRVSRHSSAALHPLNILDFTILNNTKGTIKQIKEFSTKYRLDSIRENIHKVAISIFIGELLYRTLLLSEKDIPLYNFIESAILSLNESTGNFSNFHIWFIINYAAKIGFSPDNGYENEFNPFTNREMEILGLFFNRDFTETADIALTGLERTTFLTSFIKYIEYHTSMKIDIKSINVLHKVLQ